MTKQILSALRASLLALFLSFGLSFVYAWTAPSVSAPGGNVAAPINTGDTAQYKAGNLVLNNSAIPFINGLIVAKGRVGIGTPAPVARLHVNSGIDNNFVVDGPEGVFTNAITLISQNDATTAIEPLNIKGNPVVFTSGNVGVGTPSPQAKLDVRAPERAVTWIGYNDTTRDYGIYQWITGGSGNVPYNYFQSNTGIGTPFPLANLHTYATENNKGAYIEGNIGGNVQTVLISPDATVGAFVAGCTKPDGTTSHGADGCGRMIVQNAGSEGFQFQTSRVDTGANLWTTRMVIKNNGNVGIGTTDPGLAYRLDVNGKIRATNGVLSSGSTSVSTGSREVGYATVDISSLGLTDTNYQVSLTAKPSDGNLPPDNHGPLYVPFVYNKTTTSFGILVYDIQAIAHNVTIPVDWIVVKN